MLQTFSFWTLNLWNLQWRKLQIFQTLASGCGDIEIRKLDFVSNNHGSLSKLCLKLKFIIFISLQPNFVNFWYFKLRLFDLTEITFWNILGLRHWVAKIKGLENQSLWQKLNSFMIFCRFIFHKFCWNFLLLHTFCSSNRKHFKFIEKVS